MSAALPPPATPVADLATRLAADLDHRISNLTAAASRARARSDDEAIHDVRVSARRLVALLGVWRPLFRRRSRRRAVRRLRALRRGLGPAREAEVHLAELAQRLLAGPPEARAAAGDLVARLREDVARLRRNAARRTGAGRMARLLSRLGRARSVLVTHAATRPEAVIAARARFDLLAQRAREAVAAARAGGDGNAFHEARLAIKRWRYAGESLAAAGLEADGPPESVLRRAQERLGVEHDRATLRDVLVAEMTRLRESGVDSAADALRVLAFELEGERRRAADQFSREAAALLAAPPEGNA